LEIPITRRGEHNAIDGDDGSKDDFFESRLGMDGDMESGSDIGVGLGTEGKTPRGVSG